VISLQVGDCWLWSLIIFLFHRSLFSVMFIPHEDCTPQNIVHPSMWGGCRGDFPPCGVRGAHPPGWGVWGQVWAPDGGSGVKPPKEKLPCKCIL
jgi:hypothetical protein